MSDEQAEQYKSNPKDKYKYWNKELAASKKWFSKFHKQGDKVVDRFLDNRKEDNAEVAFLQTRLNLFHANITTLMSMLYGRIPKVEVDRRFSDADDDVARVAAEILSRILNTDIEVAGEDAASVFRNSLQDRLLPGLGTARVKYCCEEGEEEVPPSYGKDGRVLAEGYTKPTIEDEYVDTIYTYWKDILWSPVRSYSELRWKAFRSYMDKEKFKARFPKCDIKKVTFTTSYMKEDHPKGYEEGQECNPQAEVWEIWDKDHRTVCWYTEGYEETLGEEEDPLGLEGFWPDPPPMIANPTTTKYCPKADYVLAQDLYREIDELETRISVLTSACKAVGVYDANNKDVQRIFTEGVENQLIPVNNWGQFSEKGGLKGVVDWVPIDAIVATITELTARQQQKIQELYQVTGMNDVMRGAASEARVSATERKLQANYGSIRIEALQNEFSRWVSDLQSLKAEIIAKHFQPQTILDQSNILATPDAALASQAVQLIQDRRSSRWRINVRPETLAIADYAQLKQDRVEFINALAMFMQSAAPLVEIAPQSMVSLVQLLKWGLAGFKGSNEIEGVIDKAVDELTKNPPKPPKEDDGKAQAEIQKMQMEMQMEQQKLQAEMQMAKEKHQADMQLAMLKYQLEERKMEMEIQKLQQEAQIEIAELQAKLGIQVQQAQVQAQQQADEQATQFAFNTAEREHEAKVSMESGDAELARDKQRAKLKPKPNGNGGSGTVRKSD